MREFLTIAKNKNIIDALEKQIEELKNANKELAEKILIENNSSHVSVGGVTISRVTRQGAIDYASIPELRGVNLENYRKKSIEIINVRV